MVKKAIRSARIISWVPFVRKVSLTGSWAQDRASESSDIDLFVQVAPGRLYLTRFVVTGLVHLLGVRRHGQNIAGRLCLNWFATFDGPSKQGRQHLLLWDHNGRERLSEKFLSGKLGDQLEQICRSIQQKRFAADPRTSLPGSQVRFSDQELGFHPPKSEGLTKPNNLY